FHVIVGDSNRSDLSLFLKFGMTSLFLKMLESGYLKSEWYPWYGTGLLNCVEDLRAVSRDRTLKQKYLFGNGRLASALEVMSDFATFAERFVIDHEMGAVWKQVVELAKGVLEGLKGDRHAHPLSQSLDWVAVERVIMNRAKKSGTRI